MFRYTCPTCKRFGCDMHPTQGVPNPKWECAEHTGEPICIVCLDIADSGPVADGWFCKAHKYRPLPTPANIKASKEADARYESVERKAKAVLRARGSGIKKAFVQIRFRGKYYSGNFLYEWKLADRKTRKFVHKLERNRSTRPAAERPELYPDIRQKIEDCCKSEEPLEADGVIVDVIDVSSV